MSRHFFSAGLFACVLLFSGCDTINNELNDALPEINVGNGVLGLDGEAGTELSGEFTASKTAGIQATATFSLNKEFADLDTGDIIALTELSTSLVLAANAAGELVVVTRGSAASLPESITISGGSVAVSLTDGVSSFSLPTTNISAIGTLNRQSGCASDASSCGYTGNGSVVFASYSLNQAQATSVLTVIGQGPTPSPNTIDLTLTLTVSPDELAGASARVRIGETNTTVQATIF